MSFTRSTHLSRISHQARAFLQTEASSGAALGIAALGALIWANSPWWRTYDSFWMTPLTIVFGQHSFSLVARDWVNEALMTVFFFVAGLEIKREIISGELRDPRRAALPIVAALGGMIVPAAIYFALNAGDPATAHGWAVPMATDVGMSIGFLALVSKRVPSSLRLFLLTLAVADDIGGIVVIAALYARGFNAWSFLLAVALVVLTFVLRKVGIKWFPIYLALGIATWYAAYRSGIHATMAGVAIAFLTPSVALFAWSEFGKAHKKEHALDAGQSNVRYLRQKVRQAKSTVSVVE